MAAESRLPIDDMTHHYTPDGRWYGLYESWNGRTVLLAEDQIGSRYFRKPEFARQWAETREWIDPDCRPDSRWISSGPADGILVRDLPLPEGWS